MNDTERRQHLIDLLDSLPDHWSVMRVSQFEAPAMWRVYNNRRELMADAGDLETALNLALT